MFDTWRNEQAAQQLRQGYEAAGDTVEAAMRQASIATAERDIRCRAFMAAERAAYADLNAVAAERENLASMEAAQQAVHEELNRAREARQVAADARDSTREAAQAAAAESQAAAARASRDEMRRAARALR